MNRLPPDLMSSPSSVRDWRSSNEARFRDLLLLRLRCSGDQRVGRDVDLLVLLDAPVDTGREILHIEPIAWPLSLEHDIVFSVMPVSHEAYQKGETSFLRIIPKHGQAA